MRELKFRAWHSTAQDMVYFGLGENNLRAYSIEEGEPYTLDLRYDYPVMQYTGLLDRHGSEIYEGDIMQLCEYYIGDHLNKAQKVVVQFNDGGFDVFNECGFVEQLWEAVHIAYGKVIGNIHQNPELLEVEK